MDKEILRRAAMDIVAGKNPMPAAKNALSGESPTDTHVIEHCIAESTEHAAHTTENNRKNHESAAKNAHQEELPTNLSLLEQVMNNKNADDTQDDPAIAERRKLATANINMNIIAGILGGK